MEVKRRGLLIGAVSLLAAPSIVRAENIMAVRPPLHRVEFIPRITPEKLFAPYDECNPLSHYTRKPDWISILKEIRENYDCDGTIYARGPTHFALGLITSEPIVGERMFITEVKTGVDFMRVVAGQRNGAQMAP